MTTLELLNRCRALEFDAKKHDEQWRNDVAADLNEMLGRIQYQLETDGDDCDCRWAAATLRVIERVAEFEEIRSNSVLNEQGEHK